MPDSSIAALIAKKSFEVGYAAFRLSANIKSVSFAAYLESYALSLFDAATKGEYGNANAAIALLTQFINFGHAIDLIGTRDAALFNNEANSLGELIRQSANSAIAIADILKKEEFSQLPHSLSHLNDSIAAFQNNEAKSGNNKKNKAINNAANAAKQDKTKNEENRIQPIAVINSEEAKKTEVNDKSVVNSGEHAFLSIEDRRTNIINRIRQSGNCRLKDIEEYMPEMSERTLRYDLQELVAAGEIERFGSGGPSTYYRMKDGAIPMPPEHPSSKEGEGPGALWIP